MIQIALTEAIPPWPARHSPVVPDAMGEKLIAEGKATLVRRLPTLAAHAPAPVRTVVEKVAQKVRQTLKLPAASTKPASERKAAPKGFS